MIARYTVGALLATTYTLSIGCVAPGDAVEAASFAVASPASCIDPNAFGAFADDGLDDRAGLQAAIDAGKREHRPVCVGPGTWLVTRTPRLGVANIGSLQIVDVDGFELVGVGPQTRFRMAGSGILAGGTSPSDWWVFHVRGRNVRLADFSVDGANRVDTEEQTHLVQIQGPSHAVRIENLDLSMQVLTPPAGSVPCAAAPDGVVCARPNHGGAPLLCHTYVDEADVVHPGLGPGASCTVTDDGAGGQAWSLVGWFKGGDCVRLLGEIATPVDGVSIVGNRAPVCDRSFVAFQRGVRNVEVLDNETVRVTDQVIDMEPSGVGTIEDVTIARNVFRRGPGYQGQFAIALAGTSIEAERILVDDNVLEGGIMTYNASRSTISNNRIVGMPGLSTPVVYIIKNSNDLQVLHNTIVRPAGSPVGSVIHLSVHNSGYPRRAVIADNEIHQYSDGAIITMEGAPGVHILRNAIDCAQPRPGLADAIGGRGLIVNAGTDQEEAVPLDGMQISGNDVRGGCNYLARFGTYRTVAVGSLEMRSNTTQGLQRGLGFINGGPTVTPIVDGNVFQGIPPANHVTPAGTPYIGTNTY